MDAFSRTSCPSVWAIGDVTNRVNLTPVALMEGMALAKTLFGGGEPAQPDYTAVPSAVFSHPELACVVRGAAGGGGPPAGPLSAPPCRLGRCRPRPSLASQNPHSLSSLPLKTPSATGLPPPSPLHPKTTTTRRA